MSARRGCGLALRSLRRRRQEEEREGRGVEEASELARERDRAGSRAAARSRDCLTARPPACPQQFARGCAIARLRDRATLRERARARAITLRTFALNRLALAPALATGGATD